MSQEAFKRMKITVITKIGIMLYQAGDAYVYMNMVWLSEATF